MEAYLFGPTYLRLRLEEQATPKPYKPLARGRTQGKGKAPQVHFADDVFGRDDEHADAGRGEFELEKNWILAHVGESRQTRLLRAKWTETCQTSSSPRPTPQRPKD